MPPQRSLRDSPAHAPDGGWGAKTVVVQEVDGNLAVVLDNFGRLETLPRPLMRANGIYPRVGERWMVDRSIAGQWTFSAIISTPHAPASPGNVITLPASAMSDLGTGSTLEHLGTVGSGYTAFLLSHTADEGAGVQVASEWEAMSVEVLVANPNATTGTAVLRLDHQPVTDGLTLDAKVLGTEVAIEMAGGQHLATTSVLGSLSLPASGLVHLIVWRSVDGDDDLANDLAILALVLRRTA